MWYNGSSFLFKIRLLLKWNAQLHKAKILTKLNCSSLNLSLYVCITRPSFLVRIKGNHTPFFKRWRKQNMLGSVSLLQKIRANEIVFKDNYRLKKNEFDANKAKHIFCVRIFFLSHVTLSSRAWIDLYTNVQCAVCTVVIAMHSVACSQDLLFESLWLMLHATAQKHQNHRKLPREIHFSIHQGAVTNLWLALQFK